MNPLLSRISLLVMIAVAATVLSWWWPGSLQGVSRETNPALESDQNDPPKNSLPAEVFFARRAPGARAVAIYDPANDSLIYGRHENTPYPIASLTKVMTALVAREHLPPSAVIPIRLNALMTEGDSGFLINEQWRLQDLLDYTLVTSSNDGAQAIAAVVAAVAGQPFESLMNKQAQNLGLKNTVFRNPTGLDLTPQESGAESSAADVARLFAHVFRTYPESLEATGHANITRLSLDQIIHRGQNTNQSFDALPGLLVSKTGFTDLANGNLVFAFDRGLGQPLVVVIMGTERNNRFIEAAELSQAVFDYLAASQSNL